MYKCYRLECNEELKELINEYKEVGKKIMEDKKESITKNLREYLREDKLIDFTKLFTESYLLKVLIPSRI